MSAQIISLESHRQAARVAAEAAWERYDVAARRVADLYRDPDSSREDRMNACMDATRLHKAFARAMEQL